MTAGATGRFPPGKIKVSRCFAGDGTAIAAASLAIADGGPIG